MKMPGSVLDLARELIRIPSVNPAGDPGTDQIGEKAIADYLCGFLREAGADVSLVEILPGRPNVVARFHSNSTAKKPRLAFAPHTDTVGVSGMEVAPFGGEVRDGRLYGRGACDTKGPMAAQLWALWQMRHQLADLSHEIIFLGLMDEEAGQAGSIAAAADDLADFVIVAEPTSMEIVHTHKGSIWLEVATHGLAAHSSRPELGKNAIYDMARVVRCIEERLAPRLADEFHPILGSPTISAGVIRGGQKINVVPDNCQLEVDVRTIPGMENFLAQLTQEIQLVCPTATVTVSKQSPALHTETGHPLIANLMELGSKPVGAPWFCDAAMFAAAGIPSIAMGPGSISQAHTADEWIEVAELERGAEFFARFLQSLQG
ncbi:MAG: M20 family metallopeptidase [Chthoniobacterales bacterium]